MKSGFLPCRQLGHFWLSRKEPSYETPVILGADCGRNLGYAKQVPHLYATSMTSSVHPPAVLRLPGWAHPAGKGSRAATSGKAGHSVPNPLEYKDSSSSSLGLVKSLPPNLPTSWCIAQHTPAALRHGNHFAPARETSHREGSWLIFRSCQTAGWSTSPSHGNHWLVQQVTGVQEDYSPRDGFGAIVPSCSRQETLLVSASGKARRGTHPSPLQLLRALLLPVG